jgi:glycosyltransferase involved in cell wall biosynthesis
MIISIITATYNAEVNLKNLIESIYPQKTDEIEFIIIDGGSTDKTLDIIKDYSNNIDYWISEPDKGIYEAWNKGIKVAKGEWIMFMGADDILLPNALKEYVILLENHDLSSYDYISARNVYIDQNAKTIKLFGDNANWNKMKKMMSTAHVASLHNKKLFNEIGCYNLAYKICADYELLLRKKEALKYYHLDKCIAKMKIGGMSFSYKAIVEAYNIRKMHKTIPQFINAILFLKNCFEFYFFIFRKTLMRYKIK